MSLAAEIRADLHAPRMIHRLPAMMNRGWHALVIYRLAHHLHIRHVPVLPLILTRLVQMAYGIDIDYRAHLEPGIVIRHGVGTVIGSGVRVGSETELYHGVTLGYTGDPDRPGFPTIGRGVLIGAGAAILGPVTVGDWAKVGANAVVLRDVPSRATAVGNPARNIPR